MKHWKIVAQPADNTVLRSFADLDAVFALEGETITQDSLVRTLRVAIDGWRFYVKRYAGLGKKPLRRLFGQPRVRAEWQNLQRFTAWGIPTAPLIAYGLERHYGCFVRGALITAEIPDTSDLRTIAAANDPRLKSRRWLDGVSRQLADIARKMHQRGFTHNDLKWRNLLVDNSTEPQLYLIDCPSGKFWRGPFLRYRIVKDLACLDKLAKHHLSRTQRLRFYLDYAHKRRLNGDDKKMIRKIVEFFKGRE